MAQMPLMQRYSVDEAIEKGDGAGPQLPRQG
jgi:hypothetical protein